MPDPSDLADQILAAMNWGAISTELRAAVQQELQDAFAAGATSAVPAGAAITYAEHRAAEMVGMRIGPDGGLIENPDATWAITPTLRASIHDYVVSGLDDGSSILDIADSIQDAGELQDWRAEMIARSESATALSRGSIARYRAIPGITSVTVMDGQDFDAACQEADGATWSLDEAEANPIEHPNCCVGSTMVVAPLSLRLAAFRRWFQGEIVVIRTTANEELAATGNHPILTPHGWVGIGQLHKGDYVVRCLDSKAMSRALAPDQEHMPTSIEQIACSSGMPGGALTVEKTGTAHDFHGDGIDGQVYIEWAARHLRRNTEPTSVDHAAHLVRSLSGLVEPVEIISVERREFVGYVYNLQMQNGWYVAEGIIAKNCTRSFAPVVNTGADDSDTDGGDTGDDADLADSDDADADSEQEQ